MLNRRKSNRTYSLNTAYTGVGSPPPNSFGANPAAIAAASSVGTSRSMSMSSNLSAAAAAAALHKHNSLTSDSLEHVPGFDSNNEYQMRRNSSLTSNGRAPAPTKSFGDMQQQQHPNQGSLRRTSSLTARAQSSYAPNPAKPPQPTSYRSSTQTVTNSDRTRSLTTTTVRQLGSFEITSTKTVPLNQTPMNSPNKRAPPPPQPVASPPPSLPLQEEQQHYAPSVLSHDSDLQPVAEEDDDGDNNRKIDNMLLAPNRAQQFKHHDPPPRSRSPIKSAMKDSSRSGSVVSASSSQDGSSARRRNRVSFTPEFDESDITNHEDFDIVTPKATKPPKTQNAAAKTASVRPAPDSSSIKMAQRDKSQTANAAKAAFVKKTDNVVAEGKPSTSAAARAAANLHSAKPAASPQANSKRQSIFRENEVDGEASDSGNSIYSDAYEDIDDQMNIMDAVTKKRSPRSASPAAAAAKGASSNTRPVEAQRKPKSLRKSLLKKSEQRPAENNTEVEPPIEERVAPEATATEEAVAVPEVAEKVVEEHPKNGSLENLNEPDEVPLENDVAVETNGLLPEGNEELGRGHGQEDADDTRSKTLKADNANQIDLHKVNEAELEDDSDDESYRKERQARRRGDQAGGFAGFRSREPRRPAVSSGTEPQYEQQTNGSAPPSAPPPSAGDGPSQDAIALAKAMMKNPAFSAFPMVGAAEDDSDDEDGWMEQRRARRRQGGGGGGFAGLAKPPVQSQSQSQAQSQPQARPQSQTMSQRQAPSRPQRQAAQPRPQSQVQPPQSAKQPQTKAEEKKPMTAQELAKEMMKNQQVSGGGSALVKRTPSTSSFERTRESSPQKPQGPPSARGGGGGGGSANRFSTMSLRAPAMEEASPPSQPYFQHHKHSSSKDKNKKKGNDGGFKSRFEDSDSEDDFAMPPLPQSPLNSPEQYLHQASASNFGGAQQQQQQQQPQQQSHGSTGSKLKGVFSPNREARFLIPKKSEGKLSSHAAVQPSQPTMRQPRAQVSMSSGGPADNIAPKKQKKFKGLRKVFGIRD